MVYLFGILTAIFVMVLALGIIALVIEAWPILVIVGGYFVIRDWLRNRDKIDGASS